MLFANLGLWKHSFAKAAKLWVKLHGQDCTLNCERLGEGGTQPFANSIIPDSLFFGKREIIRVLLIFHRCPGRELNPHQSLRSALFYPLNYQGRRRNYTKILAFRLIHGYNRRMESEKFGRYEIIAELGRGGMATVYRARDPRFDREVALKVLPREMLHDPQFRTRFEREAKTIAMLEHPAIVPVYDFGEEDGQPYFVMRYMTGGSLSDRLKNGHLTLPEAARLFTSLAQALDSAHARGIIHRDLKPGNILFDHYGEPYVSDFGIAKLTEAQSSVTGSAIIGTPAYMSPEQAQGEGVDGRSDIYGLGVILFEALTGQQPFFGDTPMSVVVKHITDPVPHILDIKPDLPTGVEKIIEKALAKDRNERFATCQALADALNSVAVGKPVDIGPAPTATRMSPPKTQASKQSEVAAQTVLKKKPEPVQQPRRKGVGMWIGLGIGLLALCILAVGGIFIFRDQIPLFAQATNTPTLEIMQATRTPDAILPTDTTLVETTPLTVLPSDTPTSTATPRKAVIGGTDMIALVNANNIWVLRPDGTELLQVTTDGAVKHSLSWSPDGQSVFYISGKCIWSANIVTQEAVSLTCFNSATYLEDLAISPDGKQIAISLDRVLYIVPFDVASLTKTRNHADMTALNGCFTYDQAIVKRVRWAGDSQRIAVVISAPEGGRRVDLVRAMDISTCNSVNPRIFDTFPETRFVMSGYSTSPVIPSYDWDGADLFLLNSFIRNDVYGNLYQYNMGTFKGKQIDPLNTGCCYTDVRWSPDGSYILFAYQNQQLGEKSKNLLYYIPYGTVGTGASYTPIPLPENFLLNPREHPEAVLRPAQ